MVTYFNKADMISFGKYMVSQERTDKIINHPEASKMPPVTERLQQVHDADFENWLEWKENKKLEASSEE